MSPVEKNILLKLDADIYTARFRRRDWESCFYEMRGLIRAAADQLEKARAVARCITTLTLGDESSPRCIQPLRHNGGHVYESSTGSWVPDRHDVASGGEH